MSSPIRQKGGFTLVEVLTYGAGLLIILAGLITFLIYLYDWYRSVTIPVRADQAGVSLMHMVMKDIRGATTIDDSASVFNSDSGKLSVTATIGSNSTTTIYVIENGRLKKRVGASATTTVSSSDAYLSAFNIKKLATPKSSAVRVVIGVDYHLRTGTTTNVYDGLAVLRQSYE